MNSNLKVKHLVFAVAGLLVAFASYTWRSQPRNLADCYLMVAREADSDHAADVGMIGCSDRFPEPKIIDPFKSNNPWDPKPLKCNPRFQPNCDNK